jgi:release factor glutamine methyltransferase
VGGVQKAAAGNIRDILREAAKRLAALPQSSPRLEAELLLCDAAGLDRTRLMAWPETEIDEASMARFQAMLERRLAGEPIAYIRGHQAFWTLDLLVTPHTLIPRPETELLVELTLDRLPASEPLLVLDAGSGSGAIACALALERPAWTLIATDRSTAAARVARDNLLRNAADNARVVSCDWLAPVAEGSLHAVVANPPYIPESDPHLRRGDLLHEPRTALAAGRDGLAAFRELSVQGASRLRESGFIALEHGFDQGEAVRTILARQGFSGIETHRDLAGHERATCALLSR